MLSKLRRRQASRSLGQSLVEFALVLPVLMLLLLVAVDFGRVYLGWVNLQQMARIAANYAADHASAWQTPRDQVVIDRYRLLVNNDIRNINCVPPSPLPDPVFPTGPGIGQAVHVQFDCQFSLITPIISRVLGNSIIASAGATYPVKQGIVATVPGGGNPIVVPPVASFVASPRSGWSPLVVTMTDTSMNQPTSWTWDFNVAPTTSGSATGSVVPPVSVAKGPHSVTYTCTGNPGDTCTFGVSLQVQNAGGANTASRPSYVTVTVPPPTGPIAEFTGTPRSGTQPLSVNFAFTDLRNPPLTYTLYQWDFTNDGTFDATGATTSHTYSTAGLYDVALRVTDNTGATSTLVKVGYILVGRQICTVPDFATTNSNQAQALWSGKGFTGTITVLPSGQGQGNGNYKIVSQTILGGTVDPQPNGCASSITVGP